MDCVILNEIPFVLERESLLAALRIPPNAAYADELRPLIEEARRIGRPKALYGIAPAAPHDEGSVVVDGAVFRSRVLRVNLDGLDRAFPFLATCGSELEGWSASIDGMLRRYCADMIKELALEAATLALQSHLVEAHGLHSPGMMNPGSLPDWPAEEQKPLFALFGAASDAIGVRLTDTYIMQPVKSVSGLLFASAEGFESCRLCQMRQCPRRRVPYDPTLYESKYGGGRGWGAREERDGWT